jgi:hypothetical protein
VVAEELGGGRVRLAVPAEIAEGDHSLGGALFCEDPTRVFDRVLVEQRQRARGVP